MSGPVELSHWRALRSGSVRAIRVAGEPTVLSPKDVQPSDGRLVFPGAFNPLHRGHLEMARIAESKLGLPVEYEIAARNVDKGGLTFAELTTRLRQFDRHHAVWVTRAAEFLDKSSVFPGATFLVGADTILRFTDVRYHGGDSERRAEAARRFAEAGCRFLVFGRRIGSRFLTLRDLSLPSSVSGLCEGIEEEEFRADISSTSLRNRRDSKGG